MSCQSIQEELVAYHFGEIEAEARTKVEQHLLSCQPCLEDFLAIKREIETAESAEAPSRAAAQSLRAAVAEVVSPKPKRRAWSWWERPFAVLCAGTAMATALFLVQILATSPGTPPVSLRPPSAELR